MRKVIFLLSLWCLPSFAERLLIPMDSEQRDHLKEHMAWLFWAIERGVAVEWLLNYRGGVFMLDYHGSVAREAQIRGVSADVISEAQAARYAR